MKKTSNTTISSYNLPNDDSLSEDSFCSIKNEVPNEELDSYSSDSNPSDVREELRSNTWIDIHFNKLLNRKNKSVKSKLIQDSIINKLEYETFNEKVDKIN